ncbi:relaxase/mobilization nuclease domain-containing protein [Spirillospora sp. NPDC048911]|uniref:relaxase/mobilization nuclease domain-containing protein n=1 Tax=Spirillospora sp. NPDC048911 TaxID=3364527 RepID=UPI00371ADD9F
MIGKVQRGQGVQGLIRYLYGPGKNEEHRHPHIVAGFRSPAELEPAYRDGRLDLRRLDGLLTQPLALLGDRNDLKPVWHVPVRAAPEDPVLTDQQWAAIAHDIMARTGLAPPGDDDAVRWIAIRHADDHIHIVATLARADGIRPDVWNDGYRIRSACRAAENRYGLRRTAPADRTAARRPSRGEAEKAVRHGRTEPPRTILRRNIQTAAAGARTEREFFTLVQAEGVLVRRRFSKQRPDQLTGYAVALPDDRTATGQPVWYGGGKLAADLTLPKLRQRWSASGSRSGPQAADYQPVSGRQLSERSARAVLRTTVRQAADQARTAEEFFQRLHQAGLVIRQRFSETAPGQVTGYAVTLPDHTGNDGQPVWYSGGRLADDLTWPRLQQRWNNNTRKTSHRSSELDLSPQERQAIYDDAARAAAYATAQIRRCIAIDPHAARDACWAAADVLHAAAHATGNPHLRRAADSYDRAARTPFGHIPKPTPSGSGLRTAARLLSLVSRAGTGAASGINSLVNALVTLVETFGQLHTGQRRDAQASACSTASQHLRRTTHIPAVPWAAERSHASGITSLATKDFPTPWAPSEPNNTPDLQRTPRSGPALPQRPTRRT